MTKWEYKVINIRSENYRLDPNSVRELNALGEDGWELVSITSVNFKTGAISIDKHIPGNSVSYGAGLEAGVYIGHFLIGAEGGYQNVKFKDADDGAGHTASFDASGVYGKGMIGLTFF